MTIIKPLVTRERFADITCLNGYAFGVETFCNDCSEFKMNYCARRALLIKLNENQINTERKLGYDLSVKYRWEDVMWDGRSRIQTKHGPIATMNVIQTQDQLEGNPFEVSPFIAEGVSVTIVDTKPTIVLDSLFFDNPSDAVIRKVSNNSVISQDLTISSFPRRNEDGNWIVAIDNPSNEETVNVTHCKYIYVFVPQESMDIDADIVAVYPGTEQYIPLAKPIFEDDDDNYVFTFYSWSLVAPAFASDDLIDLKAGHFYKLLQEVELLVLEDQYQGPIIIEDADGSDCNCPMCPPSGKINVAIISDRVVEFSLSGCPLRCGPNAPMKIRIFYKTDPELVEPNLETVAQAIVYLTAAELPLKDCGCPEPKEGFIHMAQESYGDIKINQVTGAETVPIRYGQRHGQVVYLDYINRTVKKRTAVIT